MKSMFRCRNGQILGGERFLLEFSETCLKSFCATYAYKLTFFGMTTKKGLHVLLCFPANVGPHFCPNFQEFCWDFALIFKDFRQIKTFGVRLHRRLLHHWACNTVCAATIQHRKKLLSFLGPTEVCCISHDSKCRVPIGLTVAKQQSVCKLNIVVYQIRTGWWLWLISRSAFHRYMQEFILNVMGYETKERLVI